jgi:hypothetical protein
MAKKPKLKTFSVGFVVSVWFDKDIKAETFEQAYALAKLLKFEEITKDFPQQSVNDCRYECIQVYSQDILDKYGF